MPSLSDVGASALFVAAAVQSSGPASAALLPGLAQAHAVFLSRKERELAAPGDQELRIWLGVEAVVVDLQLTERRRAEALRVAEAVRVAEA